MTAQTILPANSAASGGFDVANSCRFDSGSSAYMHKTPDSASNRRTFTISTWIKRSKLGASQFVYNVRPDSNGATGIFFTSGDVLFLTIEPISKTLVTNRVFRDISAWYHIVYAIDTTQGTAANRIKLYVNGVQETSFSAASYPDQNADLDVNTANPINIGRRLENSSDFIGAYLSEFVFIDGLALAPTSFGEFDEDSGIWKPKRVSGLTFGTNGFYLNFQASGNLGNDASGGTDLTESGLAATDQTTDTCTNNFATWNPLACAMQNVGNNVTFSEGNLKAVGTSGGEGTLISTIAVNSGKWYAEFKMIDVADGNFSQVALLDEEAVVKITGGTGATISRGNVTVKPNGDLFIAETRSQSWGPTFTDNDIIQIAADLDNGAFYFGKNGTYSNSGDPTTGASKTGAAYAFTASSKLWFFAGGLNGTGSAVEANFGNPSFAISSSNTDGDGHGNFEFAVPSGYFALNTKNLAEYGG